MHCKQGEKDIERVRELIELSDMEDEHFCFQNQKQNETNKQKEKEYDVIFF